MLAGYRITRPEEAGRFRADLVQISVYRGMKGNLGRVEACARACREIGRPYVIHPVNYSLLDEDPRTLSELKAMAEWSDLGFILHDEVSPGGGRVMGGPAERLRRNIGEMEALAPVSFEDAVNVTDVLWFWGIFARSVTLDIGHLEAAGIDALEFVKALDPGTAGKIDFVHMHRKHLLRGGLVDHWPLVPGCRELAALGELLKSRPDVRAILELNEDETENNLRLLYALDEESRALRASRLKGPAPK
ncbi:MAG: hypothetical protein M0Z58_07530 [Nitrospiraceae bacterium]|nr:hypothetical protein [Nitrospiraceae bacterium]